MKDKKMDWTQTLTFIGTTIASVFGFFLIIRDDIKKMDEKWERLFSLFVQDKIDASKKWK